MYRFIFSYIRDEYGQLGMLAIKPLTSFEKLYSEHGYFTTHAEIQNTHHKDRVNKLFPSLSNN